MPQLICHAIPRQHATSRHVTPRHATPRHATPRHTTPHHATPHHATPALSYIINIIIIHYYIYRIFIEHCIFIMHCIHAWYRYASLNGMPVSFGSETATPALSISRHVTPHHATSYHATSYHATPPRHTIPYHATPRHATPRHTKPRHAIPRQHATSCHTIYTQDRVHDRHTMCAYAMTMRDRHLCAGPCPKHARRRLGRMGG